MQIRHPSIPGATPISVTIAAIMRRFTKEFTIVNPAGINDSTYANITFWMNGGASGGQKLQAYGLLDGSGGAATAQAPRVALAAPPANTWQLYTVCRLSSLSVCQSAQLHRLGLLLFRIQRAGSNQIPTFYMDDITLVTGTATNPVSAGTNALISILVNAQSNRIAINPMIYGTAFATSNQLMDLNFTMNRSGGNSETRYNWQTNAHNLAADWYFESYPDSSSTPGATADAFVADSVNGGAQPMISILDDREVGRPSWAA